MWKQRPYDECREKSLLTQGKSKLLARLFSQRNIDPDTIEQFIGAEYKDLSHPFFLNDMKKAAEIFIENSKNKGAVCAWGDFDADGILSVVMIKELCNSFGLECNFFLPSRLEHGYGLNEKTVAAFFEKIKSRIDLLIIADCGTNSFAQIKILKEKLGCKIIILDHHTPDENTNNVATNADALVSWHLTKNAIETCACGEIFQFVRAIRQFSKKANPIEFLTLAAVGIVADVSPIIGDNRIIVKNGLTTFSISHMLSSGLIALMKQSRILAPVLTQMDVSFKIAPKINAAGRIFQPDIVYGLMIERDPDIAQKIAEYISSFNEERKVIQKQIEQQALLTVEAEEKIHTHGILIFCESWHIGVVGIVASKMVEEFNKPCIVAGKNGEIWKGSGRSVKGVNLKDILDLCPEIFEGYGGHAGAVGVTLKSHSLNDAPRIFNEACKKYFALNKIEKDDVQYYDAKLGIKVVNEKTSKMLAENMYPYCQENNVEPVFLLAGVTINSAEVKEGKGWKVLSFTVEKDGEKIEAPFKMFSPKFNTEIEGRTANIYFSFPQMHEQLPNKYSIFDLLCMDIEMV